MEDELMYSIYRFCDLFGVNSAIDLRKMSIRQYLLYFVAKSKLVAPGMKMPEHGLEAMISLLDETEHQLRVAAPVVPHIICGSYVDGEYKAVLIDILNEYCQKMVEIWTGKKPDFKPSEGSMSWGWRWALRSSLIAEGLLTDQDPRGRWAGDN
jgi:hypothetical protein